MLKIKFVPLYFIVIINSSVYGQIKWLSFNEGLEKASKESKMIIIDFYTDWCGWCKKMDKDTYNKSAVIAKINEKFIPVKLNPEKAGSYSYKNNTFSGSELQREMRVSGFPATVFLDEKGELIESIPGYMPEKTFLETLEYFETFSYNEISFDAYKTIKIIDQLIEKFSPNADLYFLKGVIYQYQAKNIELAKYWQEQALMFGEDPFILSNLYEMYKALGFQDETNQYKSRADNAGIKTDKEIFEKVNQIVTYYQGQLE